MKFTAIKSSISASARKVWKVIKEKGFLVTFVLSFTVLCVFFGKPLSHPNTVYFGVSGDGIQAYYTSLYHAKYDNSFIHFKGMNYPYGENVFFTGCQPMITGFMKIFGLSGFIVGITNLIMLLSIPLCALFLYLIFKELKIHYLYAAVCAVAISCLSPQLVRMFAHYTLTYQFAIPAFIYFLVKFYQAPSLKRSLLISFFSFFMASTHLYFFGFFAVISGFYWLILFLFRKDNFKSLLFCIKHFSIQLIIPFVVLQLITVITNTVHDRTAMPFGLLLYKSNWWGVFFPFNRFYEYIPKNWGLEPQEVNPEGYSYVGIIALFVTAFLILKLVRDILNFELRKFFMFTDNLLLNILAWAAIVALFYSFGYPFVFGHEEWAKHIGFLKQMRSIGRFAWLYYYVINILAVYLTYRLISYIKWKPVKVLYLTIIACFFCADAYQSVLGYNNGLNNRLPELADKENLLPENQWLTKIKVEDFQAIIPLPYFHLGSENLAIVPLGNIQKNSHIISLKTGLPLTAVAMSRTSMSQTFKNVQIVLEPNEPLKILEEMPDKRPFLLIVEDNLLDADERRLLENSTFLFKSKEYMICKLDYDVLANLHKKQVAEAVAGYKAAKLFRQGNYSSTDSTIRYVQVDYDTLPGKYIFRGSGALQTPGVPYHNLYYDKVPGILPDADYSVSFWMHGYEKDLNLRTGFAVECMDSSGVYYGGIYATAKDYIKRIEGDWVLIEGIVKLHNQYDKLKVTLWSTHLDKTDSLEYDDFLVRPLSVDVYREGKEELYKNNRYFKLNGK